MRVPKKMVEDMAGQIMHDLLAQDMIDHKDKERLLALIHQVILDELMVEDKIGNIVLDAFLKQSNLCLITSNSKTSIHNYIRI